MENKYLQVAGFLDNSLVNGLGLRSVVFVSGCKHNCEGCHNKEMQSFCYGDKILLKDILKRIESNMPLIKGVTFSGGEPLEYIEELKILSNEVKKLGLNVWCYTGYTFEYIKKEINKNYDLKKLIESIDVLVDGKYDKSQKDSSLKYRGSSNQRIIDVKKSLNKNEIVILNL
ncbi:anaerobic ribonucleoside-triphosphate reductase activating protein [Clostridium tepidum]|jgi:anaerobic ribonucleoside-triphosphate reductase activating protein|uniref:Anaerobic ribonucleoside-triphosphate reductase-activating protein n=1 Tax=Clostridium tepidum TaxID=1962263 RepID=A0A1S9I7B1_9CLOT|nr:anaerobic ribonucleoside-triphosphate reductase activating protein [Clostridium tepidum]MCR1935397.1 anaerobic ribonucleoside-triphosphate reductase activating protein [Clostridium tepidum]MDU6877031.1 anaerobic ribonucleoside-triphosphate reductase activating protein [Clostridium botulinum]OOO62902.1 anaerobic ribonucleoside-triphosphate reductase activating protein [Clostridium tepidum]OOO66224.1 anaerobic ribonucleoside-triphosphate reductase activating protein [Clostridium tepidum]